MRFDRSYCNYPVCNASRTSFLSGRYPETTGVLGNGTQPRVKLGAEFQFLPEYFRSQGYFTAGIGKIAHGSFPDSIKWDVSAAAAGTVNLTFRYANGAATNRPLALRVNGVTVNPSLSFNSTGSWTAWRTVTVTVQLAAGVNSISLATTGSNGANFDSLTVG